jgi:dephospho-CoA kinase
MSEKFLTEGFSENSGSQPLRVGLTGGIGSGKSTVARMFADLGVCVIDADDGARAVVRPGSDVLGKLAQRFGKDILHDDGSLNRRRLRSLIFDDPLARGELEAQLHPAIWSWMIRSSARAQNENPDKYQILVIPLLVETGLQIHVDRVLVVDCPDKVQEQRLMDRDAETAGSAQSMIAAQATREQRLEIADDILDSSQPIKDMQIAVGALHDKYRQISKT